MVNATRISGNRNSSSQGTICLSDLCVDDEFQALIPPPADEDRRQLLINLERDGFRDPLVVWSNGNILLDGHNRLDIWRTVYEDKGETTPPPIRVIDLPDREAARRWIITNQLGRRNLTTMQRAELAMQLEPAIAEQAKQNQQQSQGRGKKGCPKSDNLLPIRTDEAAAKQAGIGKDTYRKAKRIIAEADPETLEKTRSGETSINNAYNQLAEKSQKGQSPSTPEQPPEIRGRGVELAYKAVEHLMQIPEKDALRDRGFEIVSDWIERNKGGSTETEKRRGIGAAKGQEAIASLMAIPEGDQRERAIQCVVDWIASTSSTPKGKRSKKYVITFEMAMKVGRLVGGQKKWSRSDLVSRIEYYHRGRGEHFIAYFQGHPAFEYIEHGNGRVSLTIDESVAGLAEKCDRLEERLREIQAGENS